MELSKLHDFLEGKLTASEFSKEIKNEVAEYKEALKILGKSSPIYLNEDIQIEIGKTELGKLCQVFLSKKLNEYEISYITDALLLSNNIIFESEQIEELLELLTDPEINGTLTNEKVEEILAQVKSLSSVDSSDSL
jgi:hypothetical protein